MKHLPTLAGALLGLIFIASGIVILLKLVPAPSPPEGSIADSVMGAFRQTGYMSFVKVLEIVGGVLVAIPALRAFGLLILGPIIVNILAFHFLIIQSATPLDPTLILICSLAAYLLWIERRGFLNLCRCGRSCTK